MRTLEAWADAGEVRMETERVSPQPNGHQPSTHVSPMVGTGPEPARQPRFPGPTLVVVDDDAAFRTQLCELLEDEGFTVVGEGADGHEGIQVALELRPDVVLMDVRMPRLGGIEAAGIIRDRLARTQVIILSAYEDAAMTRGAESAGVYCYLVKGCRPDLITQMVRAAHSFSTETT